MVDTPPYLTLASFFAGVGGIDLGFENTGKVRTIYANEVDPYPVRTFEHNFPLTVDVRSIKDVPSSDIPDVDIVVGGFPCQAFSIEGAREGFKDTKGRGELFFDLLRVISDKRPRVVFLENVKNLVSHDKGNTFKVIMGSLENEGYTCVYAVLNAAEYGNIPQNRERIYIVGFRDEQDASQFEFPNPVPRTTTVRDFVDYTAKLDPSYYSLSPLVAQRFAEAMDDPSAVYQRRRDHVRKNRSGVVPTLTASMGTGGGNVPYVVTEHGPRKLTVRECFRLQGFPDSFSLPPDMSPSRLYKQAGNSVCVPVIERIADAIVTTLE